MEKPFDIKEIILNAKSQGCSDLHLCTGRVPVFRISGRVNFLEEYGRISNEDMISCMDIIAPGKYHELLEKKSLDFAYSIEGIGRLRVNAYFQRGTIGVAMRLLNDEILKLENLNFPPVIKTLTEKKTGLILVTGQTGSGKSTTLASMINEINISRPAHILTIEDPIEYLHKSKKSLVNQREVGSDVIDFSDGLRGALRQDPDVILVGEMRDVETIKIALTAAETGHMVFSSLHTNDAPSTIDRIIDVFPPEQQPQIRIQLADVLQGIVCQKLLPKVNGGRVAALEILISTDPIKNLIRESKCYMIPNTMQTSQNIGMVKFEGYMRDLLNKGLITEATFNEYCPKKR